MSKNPIDFIFNGKEHENFFFGMLSKLDHINGENAALAYCLGISADTRRMVGRIFDFERCVVKPECLNEGWQTSGSMRITRLAFNLYCGGLPSVNSYDKQEDKLYESYLYSPDELFCCPYAPYFLQAIQLRYQQYMGGWTLVRGGVE